MNRSATIWLGVLGRGRRRSWRTPILAVYLLVLLGSPVGEVGLLGVHLWTEHGGAGVAFDAAMPIGGRDAVIERRLHSGAAGAHEDAGDEEHRHPHAQEPAEHPHSHPHPHHDREAQSHEHLAPATSHDHDRHEARPVDADHGTRGTERGLRTSVPHDHGGKLHTHEGNRSGEVAALAGNISEFYLSPPGTGEPFEVAAGPDHVTPPPAADQQVERVDTPPPRRFA